MMYPQHHGMPPEGVYRHAANLLQTQLQWADYGRKCTVKALLLILFYAAGQWCSLAMACQRLRTAPSDQAVRDALRALCPPLETLEQPLNNSFAAHLPKALRQRRQRVAIDLILIPYHGQPHRRVEEIYRGQAKSGTTHFHAYATAYLVHRGRRFTVALTPVEHGADLVALIKRLLRTASRAGIRPNLLLLDRGFYSGELIRYLQAARSPFIMPVICRGRRADDPRGPRGTRVFATHNRHGWFRYTLTSASKRTATVPICVHCRNWQGRRNRHGRQTLLYACWGVSPTTTHWVYQVYRQRFGIETRYRQLHQARLKTSTRDPLLRLLCVGIALRLRNVWLWVHWHCVSTPRRGGRQLKLHSLRFATLLIWLVHLAEQTFAINDRVVVRRLL